MTVRLGGWGTDRNSMAKAAEIPETKRNLVGDSREEGDECPKVPALCLRLSNHLASLRLSLLRTVGRNALYVGMKEMSLSK